MNNSLSNPDPRTFPLKDLAAFCTGFIPSRIGAGDFEPTRADGRDIQKDLELFARKVDAVVYAYGEYMREFGVISDRDLVDCFEDQLRNALEGNATYVIEEGIRQRIADRIEAAE